MYCFGGESVRVMLKLSVKTVITELFILKMNCFRLDQKKNCLNLYKMLFS